MKNNLRVLLILFLFSCGTKSHQKDTNNIFQRITTSQEKLATLSIVENEDLYDVATDFSGINLIALESNNDCQMGQISKIFFSENRIIIYDQILKCVFFFNSDGKYLYKIDKKGKGPGEYIDISTIDYNRLTKEVIIADLNYHKLLIYSIDGVFLREKIIPFTSSEFCISNNYFFFYTNYNPNIGTKEDFKYNLIVTDNSFRVVDKIFGFSNLNKIHLFSSGTAFAHYLNSEDFLFNPVYSDTIYEIQNYTIQPKYVLDFKGKKLSIEFFSDEKISPEKFQKVISEKIPALMGLLDVKKRVFFYYYYEQKFNYVFIEKNSTHIKCFNRISDKKKLFKGIPFIQPIASSSNSLVSVIEPSMLIDLSKNYSQFLTNDIVKLASTLQENSNPILLLYNLN